MSEPMSTSADPCRFTGDLATPLLSWGPKVIFRGAVQTLNKSLKISGSLPWVTHFTGVVLGFPVFLRYSSAMECQVLRSPSGALAPVHTKIAFPASTNIIFFSSRSAFVNFPSSACGNGLSNSVKQNNLVSAADLCSNFSSGSPSFVTLILPPKASQNSGQSGSVSRKVYSASPCRSLSRMCIMVSNPFFFSCTFDLGPFHKNNLRPRSKMNTSPVFNSLLDIGTSRTRTVLFPFTNRRRRIFSGSTWWNPDSTPPGR
mmetsp:Transcript_7935/g.18716  ORF Transcript_7935/g.18716 Transcript_7935/m.18716 type:complete len:258 (+) Transcript_7935:1491-2264(+)